jgi:hypothetical protein
MRELAKLSWKARLKKWGGKKAAAKNMKLVRRGKSPVHKSLPNAEKP